jgi:CubicO group peptidase (beta-lactamase class C family)
MRYLQPTAGLRERFTYNNLMYMVAGRLVGRLTGGTWEQFVQRRIFDDLEMERSGFGTPPYRSADVAQPYRLEPDGELVPAVPYDGWAIGPAFSIYSTAHDMGRWLRLLLGMGELEGRRLIESTTVREMVSPQTAVATLGTREMPITTYGLGWFVQTYRGRLMAWHSGTIDGNYAMVAMLPFDDLGVAILTNRANHPMPEIVSRWIFDRFLGLPEIDWSTVFELQEAAIEKARRQQVAAREARRKTDTAPRVQLTELAGRYRHPAYGDFEVSFADERLSATFHGMTGPLRYFHENAFIFELTPYELREEMVVRFLYGDDDAVLSTAVSMENNTPPVVFLRLSEATHEREGVEDQGQGQGQESAAGGSGSDQGQ